MVEVKLEIPPALLRECAELKPSPSDTLLDILRTHVSNMGSANQCRLMHNALVYLLEDKKEVD